METLNTSVDVYVRSAQGLSVTTGADGRGMVTRCTECVAGKRTGTGNVLYRWTRGLCMLLEKKKGSHIDKTMDTLQTLIGGHAL